ncbi:unnamed protein product, partial [Didymodactylos carnosus]
MKKEFDWYQEEKYNVNLNDFMEASDRLIDYLEKCSLIEISGLKNINSKANIDYIEEILNELKRNYEHLEKCSLKLVSNDKLKTHDHFRNEILFAQSNNSNEFTIKYRTLIGNQIDSFIIDENDNKVLFDLLKQRDDDDQIYSLIKSKKGSIYQNEFLFDELIFIEVFFK